jgi:hypothetical protein
VNLVIDLSRETLEYSIRIAVCADMWAPNVTDNGGDIAIEVKTACCSHRLAVPVEICLILPSTIETLKKAKVDCTVALEELSEPTSEAPRVFQCFSRTITQKRLLKSGNKTTRKWAGMKNNWDNVSLP